ncbi:trypsin-like serine protease [Rhizoclosmatium globosum]|uniref:Trypsin-like serine protease n=1 Tax=Rhizoclosmatium globosum TaxID=329046 RepID=A0A1Y2BR26_9FUNG|nr:trypsin-like serine protease [Rhizoclosmatium globosum]|eukprot:ORY37077.1 trypsin-like serine protease [Rhizoclosmatium globosum]
MHCDSTASSWFTLRPQQRQPQSPYSFIADAAEKVADSVVNILLETDVKDLFSSKTVCSRGSGFFVSADGKILTNAHVVEDWTIIITLSDGREYPGRVHAVDFLSDLAIIQIEPNNPTDTMPIWKPVHLGSNNEMRAGDWVVSIGNPMGLQNTVTAGVISSYRRKSQELGRKDSRVEYLQTDCVVHTGSSGGPLINLDGHVIGINTIRADSEGISFAIKVNHSIDMIHQLMTTGKITRPWFGFGLVSLSPYVWQQLRSQTPQQLLPQTETGVLITYVEPDSPASLAGCKEGDVIVEVNGSSIGSASKLLKTIGLQVDLPISIKVKRIVLQDQESGQYQPTDITLTLQPQEYDTSK